MRLRKDDSIRVSTYRSASDFLAHTQGYLEHHEAYNTLMLGICQSLIDTPEEHPDFYLWTVDSKDGIHLVALLTPPFDLLLYAESLDWAALVLLVEHLRDQRFALPGVVGTVETVHAFADLWTNHKAWSIRRNSRIYELRDVIFPEGIEGHCIQASAEHRALVAIWLVDFHHEKISLEKAFQIADLHIDKGTMLLWEVEDTPVSMAVGPVRESRHGGMINFVYTPPEYRGNGYASAVVAALSQQILDSGKAFCSLFTNLANPTSNSIYQKIGFVPCGDFDEVKFEQKPIKTRP
jgi:GNAT superfamily N-acetyltransferase